VRLLLAPNAFKGSVSAARVASIWERALADVPGMETIARPLSDGGDGALEVWERLLGTGSASEPVRVWFVARAPLGEARRVPVLWREATAEGWIESALASGIALVPHALRDPLRATTTGTGQLLAGLLGLGAREVRLGLGGSATVDGGLGLGRALGYRFRAADGGDVEAPADLPRLAAIEPPPVRPWEAARIHALHDVRTKLLGAEGAVRVFGPQKLPPRHPDPGPVLDVLEAGLARLAERVSADLGRDVAGLEGSGAAGGLGAGLAAFAGASLESGAHHFLELAGIPELLARRGARRLAGVLTGEGSYDDQSGQGKAAGELRALCARHGVPLAVIAGAAPGARDDLVLTGRDVGAEGRLDERALGALAVEAAARIARARSALPHARPE
jgi:glycerate kinase